MDTSNTVHWRASIQPDKYYSSTRDKDKYDIPRYISPGHRAYIQTYLIITIFAFSALQPSLIQSCRRINLYALSYTVWECVKYQRERANYHQYSIKRRPNGPICTALSQILLINFYTPHLITKLRVH